MQLATLSSHIYLLHTNKLSHTPSLLHKHLSCASPTIPITLEVHTCICKRLYLAKSSLLLKGSILAITYIDSVERTAGMHSFPVANH